MNKDSDQMIKKPEESCPADEKGQAAISKKQQSAELKPFDEERFLKISRRLMKQNKEAYEELAK